MGDIAAVKSKVQEILTSNFTGITLERDGFSARQGSSRGFVTVTSKGDDQPTIVNIDFPLLFEAPASPELFEHLALHANDYIFGHLAAHKDEDGSVGIVLTHRLLGDYLDEDELGFALGWMAGVADDLDDELKAQFGGDRYHEGTPGA